MTARDWFFLGWVWVAGLTALGLGILLAPQISSDVPKPLPGQGTASLLIAASILFTAVFPTLSTTENRLISVASVLAAIFGYAGTLIILAGENALLMAIVLLYTLYLALIAFILTAIFRAVRALFARLRR